MTSLGSTELRKIYMICTSGDVHPFCSKTFYLSENFESQWEHLSLNFMTKTWEFFQGSILSVTLFTFKVINITSCIKNGVDKCCE